MRGAALPAALLFAALGLLLAFVPRRFALAGALSAGIVALVASYLPIYDRAVEIAFAGCWISVILLSAAVHLPRKPWWLALFAGADAGLWAGSVIAAEGARTDLLRAWPAVLICLPALLAIRLGAQIAVRVLSSWLIAIALLAALLPTAPTPGYVPDHMD